MLCYIVVVTMVMVILTAMRREKPRVGLCFTVVSLITINTDRLMFLFNRKHQRVGVTL